MSSTIVNEYGRITIDNEVITRIAGMTAIECYGVVGMAAKNVRDGFVQLLKRESLSKGIKLSTEGEALVFDLHIIVEYGTNISAIVDSLVSAVKFKVEEYVGINVMRINVYVEGMRVNS